MFIYIFLHFQAVLRLRIKVSYSVDGSAVLEQTEVNNFNIDMWN